MGVQNVEILPSRASVLYHMSLTNCGICQGLGTAIRLKAEVGVSKGMLPVKYFRSNKLSSCVS